MLIDRLLYNHALRRQHRTPVAFPHYEQCKHILLLFDEADWTAIAPSVQCLRAEGRQLTAVAYLPHAKKDMPAPSDYVRVTKHDFSCVARPKDELTSLLQQHYDLLIALNRIPSLPTQWMALLANADFKTGKASPQQFESKTQVLDFMIQLPEAEEANVHYLLEQILYYLQHITPQQ